MTTTIKITELTDIGANLASSTVFPVVNMAGTPTTEKTVLANIANLILAGAGTDYVGVNVAETANMVTGSNVIGQVGYAAVANSIAGSNVFGAVGSAGTAGTVTTNAQPNITSVGSLTSLTTIGGLTVNNASATVNFITTANVTLGSVSNLHIAGGTTGQLLTTNGSGNLTWTTVSSGANTGNIGFSNNIIYSNGGVVVNNSDLGNGQTAGMSIPVQGDGNAVALYNSYGNVNLLAGNIGNSQSVKAWSFGASGNLTLPGNTFAVKYANGDLVSLSGNIGNVTFNNQAVVGTGTQDGSGGLYLAPGTESVGNLQYLRVRGGDVATHIHLDTGNNSYFDQYFGDDGKYVKLESGGNISIGTNTHNWTFGLDGNLTVPGGILGAGNLKLSPDSTNAASYLDIFLTSGPDLHLVASNGANLILGEDNGPNVMTSWDGNVYIQSWDGSNASIWSFNEDGSTIFPTLDVQRGDNPSGTITGQTLLFGDAAQEAIISTADGTVSNENSQRLVINPGQGYDYGEGGDIYLWAGRGGDGSGSGGDIKIRGGQGGANTTGGTGGDGGYIRIEAGDSATTGGVPGYIDINGGINYLGTGGYVDIQGGQGHTTGGDANITGGYGYNVRGGNVNIWGGGSANGQINEGNVNIQTGGKTWTYDPSGNLTIPGGGAVWTLGAGTSGLTANFADPYKVNLGLDYTSNTATLAGANSVVIESNTGANTNQWSFDATGNLSVPGDIIGPANANFTIYSNAAVHEFVFADDGTFYAPDIVVLGGNTIYIGPGANTLAGLEHAVMIASSNHNAYIQAVINNVSDNGSADWVAQGRLGDDTGGWADFGFTSGGFNDANFTITGPGDGYLLVESYAPGQIITGPKGGNLILATGEQGTVRDIIFGTGGFLTGNIFGRISDANNSLELSRAGATITFPDATAQNTAWTGSLTTISNGNSNVSIPTANGNINFTSTGNANVVVITGTGANISGTLNVTGNISANTFIGNGNQLTGVATSTTGNWTLATGTNTVNISVPLNGTYSIWVNGNIPNGIITYTATAVVTNNNVPVLGSSYGWYYEAGNALVLTSIPTQFVGTVNNISNAVIVTTTANVFTFGITNNSGNTAVVNWGYTKL